MFTLPAGALSPVDAGLGIVSDQPSEFLPELVRSGIQDRSGREVGGVNRPQFVGDFDQASANHRRMISAHRVVLHQAIVTALSEIGEIPLACPDSGDDPCVVAAGAYDGWPPVRAWVLVVDGLDASLLESRGG